MTPEELTAFGIARHGKKGWIAKLAPEIHFSPSQVWRVATGEKPMSRRMELEIKALKPRRKPVG